MIKIIAAIFEQGQVTLHLRMNLKGEAESFNVQISNKLVLHGDANTLNAHLDKATLETDKTFDADLRLTFTAVNKRNGKKVFADYKKIMQECAKFLRADFRR